MEDGTPAKAPRQQERAFLWRTGKEDEAGEEGSKPKVYLSPAEKKRIAFIKGEFHEQATSVNAYVVFAYADPRKAFPGGSTECTEPSKVAAMVAKKVDGTQFEGRTLRADLVAVSAQSYGDVPIRDPSSTIFVGNLEFTAHEEELRIFFETLLTSELGAPPHPKEPMGVDEPDQDHTAHWVSNVRIIRDKDTRLGKGFGYVRFVVCDGDPALASLLKGT